MKRYLALVLLLFGAPYLAASFYCPQNYYPPGAQFCQTLPSEREDKNWDVFADLLYWHTGEVGTIPNSTIAVIAADGEIDTTLDLNNLKFGWDLGYRIGGRYSNIGQNQWGMSLSYTWFRSEAKNHGQYDGYVGIPSGFPLTGDLVDSDFLDLLWLFAAQSYRAHWTVLYNMFDLEVDYDCSVSKTLSLRPSLGLKGGWINQDVGIHSIYIDTTAHNMPVHAKEVLQNHFWGIGPKLRLNSKWQLGTVARHSFFLFGDFSSSYLWSFWNFSDHLTIGETVTGDLKLKQTQSGSLVLQNLLGVEWNVKINSKNACFALRFGYESQYWFDNLQLFNTYNGRQHNALTIQGGVFDLRFNY